MMIKKPVMVGTQKETIVPGQGLCWVNMGGFYEAGKFTKQALSMLLGLINFDAVTLRAASTIETLCFIGTSNRAKIALSPLRWLPMKYKVLTTIATNRWIFWRRLMRGQLSFLTFMVAKSGAKLTVTTFKGFAAAWAYFHA